MSLGHERERLHAAVDKFINRYEEDADEYPDLRIDTFAIVAIGTWTEDEDEVEAPFMFFEAKRNHVQIGLLKTCLLEREADYTSSPSKDD